ncbi:MAG: methyltransferase domain-containing protein [bacterium]|nr:methyltransferase domain-containing protein [bacterium]
MDANLVRKINRHYHEEEAAIYDMQHPEMFSRERETWRRLLRYLPAQADGLAVCDIGSGTGFVAEILLEKLGETASLILIDISPAMLARASERLRGKGKARLTCIEAGAESLPLNDALCDVVAMNSVLHHIPNTEGFAKEVDRVLKPGGVVMIAHEPNRLFWQQPVLRILLWSLHKWLGVEHRVLRLMRRAFKRNHAASSYSAYERVYAAVNTLLMRDGDIQKPLSTEEIQQYVDVHSPTATGTADAAKGFLLQELSNTYFKGYAVRHLETSAHLGKYSTHTKGILAYIEKALGALFPNSGSSFSFVAQKPLALVGSSPDIFMKNPMPVSAGAEDLSPRHGPGRDNIRAHR